MNTRLLLRISSTLLALGACLSVVSPSSGSTEPHHGEAFAAIDYAPVPGDPGQNKKRLVKLIREAQQQGARYIVLPELSLIGAFNESVRVAHHVQPELLAETIPGPTTKFFVGYAKKFGVWLAVSLLEKGPDHRYFLTAVLIDDRGQIITRCRKTMVRVSGADGEATRATNYLDVPDTIDDHGRRLGILSGDDILTGVPRLAFRGADTILITAGWDASDPIKWDEISARLSKEFSVNLVVANRLLPQPDAVKTNAVSGIYTPKGTKFGPNSSGTGSDLTVAILSKQKAAWQTESALGLPSVPVPSHQPPNGEIAELGRKLFFDKNLSSNKLVACSTCHPPQKSFTNGLVTGVGVEGRTTKRNVPTLLNVAFRSLLQWDGYASSIENFVKYPISGYTEMNFHYLDQAVPYVRSQPWYAQTFKSSMRIEKIEFEDIERALATYARTLVSGNSAFDRYYYGGDETALSESAKRGLKIFTGRGSCSTCHIIGKSYSLLMDSKFHSLGIGYDPKRAVYIDVGLGGISTDEYSGLFQTPSLRNVAETAPYMHDGSLKSLEDVVDFYDGGCNPSPHRDRILRPLYLNKQEKQDLVTFLRSLTGDHKYSPQGLRLSN